MGETIARLTGEFGHAQEKPEFPDGRVTVAGIGFSALTESEVITCIVTESMTGRGGWVATPNVDICRKSRADPALSALIHSATFVVPDGMPVIWAARLAGKSLPERVSGSSLIDTLCGAAAAAGLSVYFLGGAPGVPEKAATALCSRYPALRVAGTDAPRFGFDKSAAEIRAVRECIRAARADIVFVGMGFPRQERLITELTPFFPGMWFVGCGAAIPFAAGTLPRAPGWMQRAGLEWLFRLVKEPRRLYRRYLIDDAPYAVMMLAGAVARRTWYAIAKSARRPSR